MLHPAGVTEASDVMTPQLSPSVTACTVVARSALASAAVLASTYRRHHPGHRFVVLVADSLAAQELDEPAAASEFELVGGDWLDLDPDTYLALAAGLRPADLVEALRPHTLHRALRECDVAVYLDPETAVFDSFAELSAAAVEHGLVLVPRMRASLPRDGREPSEASTAREGAFFTGFLAAGQGGAGFLDFWAEQLTYAPGGDEARPNWFDRIPAHDSHWVHSDPRLAMAYWNLHERGPELEDGRGLASFIFRGYDPARPWLLSTRCRNPARFLLSEHEALRRLCAGYGEARAAVAGAFPPAPYGFAKMADGSRITAAMRAAFRADWLRAAAPAGMPGLAAVPPSPFAADGGAAFRDWLAGPATPPQAAAGLNRLLLQLWAAEPGLQVRFPDPCFADAEEFRTWCVSTEARRLVPRWARPRPRVALDPPVESFGVNVAGTLRTEHGLGEMGRAVLRAVEAAVIPVRAVVDSHWMAERSRSDLAAPEPAGRPIYPVTVLAMNGNVTELALSSNPEIAHQRYVIGVWAWELPELPEFMLAGLAHLDEVWAISEFTRAAIARHTDLPVKAFPMPVLCPPAVARPARAAADPVTFLFCFDFNSTGGRKNPWGLVEAFARAFPDRANARLIIKATNGHRQPAARERLRHAVGADRRIELLESFLSVEDLDALYNRCDAYVSLHRSEGFGLTVAEAMARAMPVVVTDYSSTAEFVDAGTGWPVPYTLTEVGPGWMPYPPDGVWADPDLDAAATAMRQIADDPAEALRRGAAARAHLQRTRSIEASADWVRAELTAAHASWRVRAVPGRASGGRWSRRRPTFGRVGRHPVPGPAEIHGE